MALRTDYSAGETGHAAAHNATNTIVNSLSADTGWVDIASFVTAGSGFNLSGDLLAQARRLGAFVQLNINGVTKAAGSPTLSIPVTGNVTNTVLLQGIPAEFRPTTSGGRYIGSGSGGRANSYGVYADGTIRLLAMVPTATQTGAIDCPTGEPFSFNGFYLL